MVGARVVALAEESAEVELLVALAEKQKAFNKRLAATLARVNGVGDGLQIEMGPVYNDTQGLQVVTTSAYINCILEPQTDRHLLRC